MDKDKVLQRLDNTTFYAMCLIEAGCGSIVLFLSLPLTSCVIALGLLFTGMSLARRAFLDAAEVVVANTADQREETAREVTKEREDFTLL